MRQTGEYRIRATRQEVWQALNDPEVLRACIKGCESLDAVDEQHFEAIVKARVGPVSATFKGDVALEDLDPPASYTLRGSGKGGAAGFARGEARVRLTEREGCTVLSYDLDAQVGGKLAQVGSRLVDGAARKMADEFFEAFRRRVEGGEPGVEGSGAGLTDEPRPARESSGRGYETSGRWLVWTIVGVLLLIAMSLPIVLS